MSRQSYIKEALNDFAHKATILGFDVYLSESTHFNYGCFTHRDSNRVVYVSFDIFEGLSFTGCYRPSRQCGTGWRMDSDVVINKSGLMLLLNTNAPEWANTQPVYETIDSYLKISSHSNYKLYELDRIQQPIQQFNNCK